MLEEIKIHSYRFRDYLISERKLSENSTSAYYNDICQFLTYLKTREDIANNEDIYNIETLDAFLIWLYENGITSRSIVRKMSSISIFLKFLKIEGVIKENFSYLLNRPKTSKKLPNYLSVKEVEAFIDAFDITKPEGIRDRTLFELIYSCGLRVSEVSDLNVGSVYFKESILQVFGKGNKERYVPIGERAINELNNYLKNGRPFLEKDKKKTDALFLNYRGERLSRKGIWRNLKIAAILAGIKNKNFSVHTLRHSFATHLVQNGADISSVQSLLGHKNIVTTEIYTHLDMEHIRRVYNKYHTHS